MTNFQNPYVPYQFQHATNNGIIWVQGIEGAKAYQLGPNSNVVLMDSDNDGKFYIKISDNIGMCTLRTFSFQEILTEPKQSSADLQNYVTKEELQRAIENLKGVIENGKQPIQSTNKAEF